MMSAGPFHLYCLHRFCRRQEKTLSETALLPPVRYGETAHHAFWRFAETVHVVARMRVTDGVLSLTELRKDRVHTVIAGESAPVPGTPGFAGAWRALRHAAAARLSAREEGLLYFPSGVGRVTVPAGPLLADLATGDETVRPLPLSGLREVRDAEGGFSVGVWHRASAFPGHSALWGVLFSFPVGRETLERWAHRLEGATLAVRSATEGGMTGDALWLAAPSPVRGEGVSTGREEAALETAFDLLAHTFPKPADPSLSLSIFGAETVEEAERLARNIATVGRSLSPDDLWRALVLSELKGLEWSKVVLLTEEGAILKNGVWQNRFESGPATEELSPNPSVLTVHLGRGHCGWRGSIAL